MTPQKTGEHVFTANSREQEWAWLASHPEALKPFLGEWVAVEGETIVAHGRDASAVASEAKRLGIPAPYIYFVEPLPRGAARLGL